ELSLSKLAESRVDLLTDEFEVALMKRISQFPRLVESAALAHEPHRIAFYAHDLAADFHALWNRGKELPHLRFMVEASREITEARLALVTSTAIVLRSALRLLGVQAITEMR